MPKKLFVGGISWGTTEDNLREAFGRFGEIVSATVVTDRDTGRSRGFGFVEFVEDTSASQAVEELDGKEMDGRTIRVNEAHDKSRGGGSRGDFGDRNRW